MAEGYSPLKETDLSCSGRGRTGLCVSGAACQLTAEMGEVPPCEVSTTLAISCWKCHTAGYDSA